MEGEHAPRPFGISVADFSFPLVSQPQSLQIAGMIGGTGSDIGVFERRLLPEIKTSPERAADVVRHRLDASGRQVADLLVIPADDYALLSPSHPDADVRANYLATLAKVVLFAKALGSPGLTVLPGSLLGDQSLADARANSAETLSALVETVTSAGLKLSIEAHVGAIVIDPDDVAELLDRVEGLELTLDMSHYVASGFTQDAVLQLAGFARHVHVRGARPGRVQVALAESTIDHAKILDGLRNVDYAAWLTLEYTWENWEFCNQNDVLSESILLSRELATLNLCS